MAPSIQQQLAADLKKVKAQSGDRVQRIKAIAKTAFKEAVAEVKDGTQEVKVTSKESLNNVIQTVAPREASEAVVTVSATEEQPASAPPQENNGPEVLTAEVEVEPETAPKVTIENPQHPKLTLVQALLKAAGLKAQSLAGDQYSKLKEELPERLEQVKQKTSTWDGQLSDRYGDDYAGLKQRWNKALAWYKLKLEQGKAVNAQPLERKQAQKAETLSDLGVKVAQKEEAVKEQIGQALRTITVNAQS